MDTQPTEQPEEEEKKDDELVEQRKVEEERVEQKNVEDERVKQKDVELGLVLLVDCKKNLALNQSLRDGRKSPEYNKRKNFRAPPESVSEDDVPLSRQKILNFNAPRIPVNNPRDAVNFSAVKEQILPSEAESLVHYHDVTDSIVEQNTTDASTMNKLLDMCRIQNQMIRECLAEFLGTYVLILLGCGTVAQVVLSKQENGKYLSINLGFALAVTFGIFVSRGVSGAHLNPAVSLSLCFLGKFPRGKLLHYIFSQNLGAFIGAATVGLQYYDAIWAYSGNELKVIGPTATAGIFATYPASHLSGWAGVLDQVIGTAALMLFILAIGDKRNTDIPDYLQPILVGAIVLVIGLSMGFNSGYALNPARDFGPRLFTFFAGWGMDVFLAGGSWWWVPIVAPCIGGIVGSLIYKLMIDVHHPVLTEQSVTTLQEVTIQ